MMTKGKLFVGLFDIFVRSVFLDAEDFVGIDFCWRLLGRVLHYVGQGGAECMSEFNGL